MRLWDGKRWRAFPLDGREPYRHGALIRSYGYEPSQVAVSTPATREALVRLATRSECRAAQDYGSAVPRYLTTKPSVTTGVGLAAVAQEAAHRYVVDGSPEHIVYAASTAARYLVDTDPPGLIQAADTVASHREKHP